MTDDSKYAIYDCCSNDEKRSASSSGYFSLVRHRRIFLLSLLGVCIALLLIAPAIGAVKMSYHDILECILTFDRTTGNGKIVWNVRMVRIIGGVLAGAGLAVSGVVMQCILRNPLASPYTLGLSSAAAFGAAFSIVFVGTGSMMTSAISIDNPFVTAGFAFIFSMIAVGIILLLTRITNVSAETMVLAGIAISAIFSAMLSFVQYVATDAQLANIISWSFGNLGRATWSWNMFIFATLAPVTLYFILRRWDYNAIDAGEDTAKSLGVNTKWERIIGLMLSSLVCSIIVSFFGIIAFIGLLGPHIARMLIGGDHRYLIPASIMLGSIIMVISDIIGKEILAPEVLPVGIITSMLGGPLFIYLLVRRYR